MINKKTTLILGAGSNMDYGFPSAEELTYEICRIDAQAKEKLWHSNLASINKDFSDQNGFDWQTVREFKNALSVSQLTIDAFLENRSNTEGFYEIGKASIARILLDCEKHDRLFIGEPPYVHFEDKRVIRKNTNFQGYWYKLLWQSLVSLSDNNISMAAEKTWWDRFPENKLSVITFNYDRSLEHYLFTALKSNSGKSDEECKNMLSKITIHHVYGSLGRLPWQDSTGVPYGGNSSNLATSIQKAVSSIDLIRQQNKDDDTEEKSKMAEIREILYDTSKIVFLGFGFDPVNLRRLALTPSLDVCHAGRIFGTKKGLSFSVQERLAGFRDRDNNPLFCSLKNVGIYQFLYKDYILEEGKLRSN